MTSPVGRPLPDLDAAVALADARLARAAGGARTTRRPAAPAVLAPAGALHDTRRGGHRAQGRRGRHLAHGPHPGALRGRARDARRSPRAWTSRCVERLLAEPRRAPLVMLDAEDALALTDEAVELARHDAADVLLDADWSGGGPRSLRFYRPPGLALETRQPGSCTACCGGSPSAPPTAPSRSTASCSPRSSIPRRSTWSTGCSRRRSGRWACPSAASGWRTSSSRAGRPRSWRPSRSVPPTDCARSSSGWRTTPRTSGCRSIANEHPLADWARATIVDVAGAVGRAGHRRHDPRLPRGRPGARPGQQPHPVPGADAAGVPRRGPGARDGDAGQVGRPPGAAVRGPAGLRHRVLRTRTWRPRPPSSPPTTSRSASRARAPR